jgi:hypothetical protein
LSGNPTPLFDEDPEWDSHIEKDPEKRAETNRRLQNWRPLLAARNSTAYLEHQINLIEEYANTRG